MTIKNFWSLEPGECFVAEELDKRLKKKNCQVFFPLHDTGTDLLITKGEKHIGIQVKESRSYKKRDKISENSWHQISKKKLKDFETVDFYVFVTYIPKDGERKFEKKFFEIVTENLKF